MTYGYSIRIVQEVKNSNKDKLGVRLGLLCIEKGIPVIEVAKRCKVSRPTVYNWFCDIYDPNKKQVEFIKEYIQELSQKD